MSDAFTRAAAVLFNNRDLSTAAVYGLPNGASLRVRVIRRDTEGEGPISGDMVRSDSATFELLMNEVPERPAEDSTITIGADTWRIFQTKPNIRKGVWILTAEAV